LNPELFYVESMEAAIQLKPPKKHHLILIVDRNPHVRGYLKREMLTAGYRVKLAGSCREVIETINGPQHIDGMIVDPDLPGTETEALMGTLRLHTRDIPVIIHSLMHKTVNGFFFRPGEILVQKDGASAEHLKQALGCLFDDPAVAAGNTDTSRKP